MTPTSQRRPVRRSSLPKRPRDRADLTSLVRRLPAAPTAAAVVTENSSRRLAVIVLGFGVVIAAALVMIAHRTWTAHRIDIERAAWLESNEQRAASRYGNLRVPAIDAGCRAMIFDNETGAVGGGERAPCYVPEPEEVDRLAGSGASRIQAISSAFKH